MNTHKDKGVIKVKLSDYKRGLTKWGADKTLKVSFQKFEHNYACFQGDGTEAKIMGWGITKEKAIQNLIDRLVEYEGLSF